VIAICSSGGFMLNEAAVDHALYGHIVISWSVNNPKAERRVHRDHSGLITPNPGLLGQPQRIIVKLPVEIFSKMPQLAETKGKKKKGYITLKWINDKKQLIVFK